MILDVINRKTKYFIQNEVYLKRLKDFIKFFNKEPTLDEIVLSCKKLSN